MGDPGLVALGRDDEDVVREFPGDRLEHRQAWSVDAVVVGQ